MSRERRCNKLKDLDCTIPLKMDLLYGAYIGHTFNGDDDASENLKQKYAYFVDFLQDIIPGRRDNNPNKAEDQM